MGCMGYCLVLCLRLHHAPIHGGLWLWIITGVWVFMFMGWSSFCELGRPRAEGPGELGIIHCVPDFRPVFCWCFWGWDTERGPEASKPKDAFLHTSWLCNGRPQSHASLGVWASHAVAGSTKPFGAIDRCCRCGIPGWDLPADSEIDTGRLINVELLERGASMTLFMTHCRSGQKVRCHTKRTKGMVWFDVAWLIVLNDEASRWL